MLKDLLKDKELLILGFCITNKQALSKIKELWAKQKLEIEEKKIFGRSKKDTKDVTSADMGGAIALVDPDKINRSLEEVNVRAPMGLYYSPYHKMLFTGSDHWAFGIFRGRIVRTLNNNYFNCIHFLSQSYDKRYLWVVATGIDAVIKVDIDNPNKVLASWFATESGYPISANGSPRFIDKNINHQGIDDYSTPEHTTHINSVLEYKPNKLLGVLFHQGELVEIDIKSGKTKTILSGLKQPHAIRKASFGYIISDTNGGRIIKLNSFLQVIGEINGNFNWIQDAIELRNGNIAVADANNGRIVIVNSKGRIIDEYIYGENNKRIGVLLTINTSEAINVF